MDIEALALQYETLGYVHLPGVIPSALVARLQAAFAQAAATYHARWQQEVAAGRADARYCDIPDILDQDDAFVEVIDLPELVPVLLTLVGTDVQLNHTHARLFPPGKTYTRTWHSDLEAVQGVDVVNSPHLFLKIHYFFEDLRPDQGCLAFIPGSQRSSRELPRPTLHAEAHSPMVTKVVPKAGDVVLFNPNILHMALDNDSPLVRRSLIYVYSHFWVKHYANAVPADLERHASTALRRQLFGIEEEGVSYFDHQQARSLAKALSSFGSAAGGRLKRVFRGNSMTRKG